MSISGKNSALLGTVQSHRAPMVELTRQLIAIPTENPPGNCYARAAELIVQHLQHLEFHDVRREGDCILAFIGQGERTLYFSGHYDVVPAQARSQFDPQIKGDNLGLVFVPDEETAGPRGSHHLVQRGLLGQNAIGMLTPEPTGGVIWNANRGAITLRVMVKGKPAHVGRQHEGINAFERMLQVVGEVQTLKKDVETRVTAWHLSPEAARHSILLIGGRSESGTNFNVVPDSAWFTIDRRINPEEKLAEEKQRLLALLDAVRAKGIDLEVEVLQEGESSGTPPGSPLEQVLTHHIEEITGRAPQIEMCPGLLETRFYAAKGIPAFAYGPGLLTVSHGPNEFVPIDRIVQCAQIYALTAANLLCS